MEYREYSYSEKMLRGFFHPAQGKELVLMLHGFTGNKVDHHFMMKSFAETIQACGYAVYRFDFLGTGDSDGSFFEEQSIYSQIEQVIKLVKEFQKEGYHVHLFAFSLGGVIATHVAKQETIASLFLLSPAGNFHEILEVMLEQAIPIENGYDFNGFAVSSAFVEEARTFPYFKDIASYQGLVQLVQGDCDQYVSRNSMECYKQSYQHIEITKIKKADHCFSSINATTCIREEMKKFYGKIKVLET